MAKNKRKKSMSAPSVTTSKFGPMHLLQKASTRNIRVGNGIVRNTPSVVKTIKLRDDLVKKDILKNRNFTSMVDIAQCALFGLDITVVDNMGTRFSLHDHDDGNDLLVNKNIKDRSTEKLKNSLQEPLDKFNNKTAPFYELDEGAPEYRQNQLDTLKEGRKPDLTSLVADLVDMNNPKLSGTALRLNQMQNSVRR